MSGPQINPLTVQDRLQVEAPTAQLILPVQYINNLEVGSTTPSVKNVTRLVANNSAPIDITDFKEGQEGQEIIVLGDGFTTVDDTGNIIPVGGPHLLANGTLYIFVLFNALWREF